MPGSAGTVASYGVWPSFWPSSKTVASAGVVVMWMRIIVGLAGSGGFLGSVAAILGLSTVGWATGAESAWGGGDDSLAVAAGALEPPNTSVTRIPTMPATMNAAVIDQPT